MTEPPTASDPLSLLGVLALDRLRDAAIAAATPEEYVDQGSADAQVATVLRTFLPAGRIAALRRYLVDEGFLSRDAGTYWRIGGSVEV